LAETATTEAPARVSLETIEDRWKTLTIGVYSDSAEETVSDLMTRWSDATRQIAARMIHGVQGDAEYSALSAVEERLACDLELRVVAFSEEVEASRRTS
jgi:hypothetical protein